VVHDLDVVSVGVEHIGGATLALRARSRARPSRSFIVSGVAGQADAVERAADELYGLAPADFTQARDEVAKRLREEGDRDAGKEVKSLRKPTLAAWALNHLVRHRRKDVEQLLKAGRELRKAQEKLVSSGDRAGFQRAAVKERELVAKLAHDAAALAAEAGVGSTQGLEEKLVASLHAAALDDDTAAELAAGRVVRERQAVGGFGDAAFELTAPPRRASAPKRGKAETRPPADAGRKSAEAADQAKLREQLSAARVVERRAGRELDASAKAAARAEGRFEKAEQRAAEAARQLDAAREELDEAREKEKAAREEHRRATAEVSSLEKKIS
jgi:hypothetical protein